MGMEEDKIYIKVSVTNIGREENLGKPFIRILVAHVSLLIQFSLASVGE